jgi:hypothetical protein
MIRFLENDPLSRLMPSLVILSILSLAIVSVIYAGPAKSVYGASNTYYVGNSAQPNTYYTYKVQEHDTTQGQPFLMTIYFKEFNSAGGYWIAPTTVVTPSGQVYNATLHLSGLDLTPLGNAQVPPQMRDYVAGYHSSLDWLSAFVPKPGLSLSAPYWGKIAAIGGSPIAPGGSATVTTPAGTFPTTVVTWHYGIDNNIYVTPNLPFPVKAQTYAATTGGNPPTQFAFELQATGHGQPPVPKNQAIAPKPPITIQTARGTYYIELLTWQPANIPAGKPTQFGILFKDSQQNIQNGVTYSVKATQGSTTATDVHDQSAQDGTGIQTITFPKPGPITMVVSIDAVQGQPTGEFVESSTFNLVASPASGK